MLIDPKQLSPDALFKNHFKTTSNTCFHSSGSPPAPIANMTSHTNVLVFYILTLWSSFCYGQFRVYRADTRSPEEIQRAGGFMPRGQSALRTVAPNVSMWNHANGAANGQSLENDGYVSTAVDEIVAEQFLGSFFGGTGYVYTVAAAPNFIQVAGTLGEFNPFVNEVEYAALGGFRWEQVIGWQQRDRNFAVDGFVQNPDYNGGQFNSLRANQGEPRLAGFPNGHEAWLVAPWNAFANGNCGPLPRKRLLRFRQTESPTNCGSAQSNQAAAVEYMDTACAPGLC